MKNTERGKINTIWDFGFTGNNITVIFFQELNNEFYIIDIESTEEEGVMYRDILKKRSYFYGDHFTLSKNRDLIKVFKRKQSDINFTFISIENYTYKQGVALAEKLYNKAHIDKKNCSFLIEAFELYIKRRKKGIIAIDWTSGPMDALRYLAIHLGSDKK